MRLSCYGVGPSENCALTASSEPLNPDFPGVSLPKLVKVSVLFKPVCIGTCYRRVELVVGKCNSFYLVSVTMHPDTMSSSTYLSIHPSNQQTATEYQGWARHLTQHRGYNNQQNIQSLSLGSLHSIRKHNKNRLKNN